MMDPVKILLGAVTVAALVAFWADGFMAAMTGKKGGNGTAAVSASPQNDHEARRLAAAESENGPKDGSIFAADEMHIPRGADGHFRAEGEIGGGRVSFVIDTGASHVALTYDDAERVGLFPDRLDYDVPVQTANGTAHMARVVLPALVMGEIELAHIPATVAPPGRLAVSLLGMSYLNRLSGVEFQGETLILRR